MTDRERFISIYKEKIHREGADKFLEYLEKIYSIHVDEKKDLI